MIFKNVSVVHVYYMNARERLFMGRLAIHDNKIYFEYAHDFLSTGLQLSPFKLPLQPGVVLCKDRVFDGLFGIFNDSLPDGWGRLLLDKSLAKHGLNPTQLSPLDRLCYVGSNGMGALVYEPEINKICSVSHENLDQIAAEALAFQEQNNDQFVDDLLALNGSSAGARPKALIRIANKDWIIKFRSSIETKDVGPVEYAYHLMAKHAGLNVPYAKLFSAKSGCGFFGVQRFDQIDGWRKHVHTISGLLHADHRLPNLDYEVIMKTTLWLTKNIKECETQFRNAVFNVLTHNRDDHAKNFSFVMAENGGWYVSPAYDLTFSSGPMGEHCTTIMGEGKNPTINHLLKLASVCDIKKPRALQIITDVKNAISKWQKFAEQAGVSKATKTHIQTTLNHLAK